MTDALLRLLPWTVAGSQREVRLYLLALAMLGVGTLLCLLALRVVRLDVPAAALTGAGAVAWVLTNRVGEIATLIEVRPGNGLTLADVFVLPGALLVVGLVRHRWSR